MEEKAVYMNNIQGKTIQWETRKNIAVLWIYIIYIYTHTHCIQGIVICIISVIEHWDFTQLKYWALKYMKKGNSKRMNLKVQMYFDIFLNEVLEYTIGN